MFSSPLSKKKKVVKEDDEDEQMAMFAKRFNKFIKMRKDRRNQRIPKGDSSKKENNQIVYYKCKKLRHIKYDCPIWKKNNAKKGKMKAMVATWSDSDNSDDDESMDDEIANLYFMALEEHKVTSNSCDSTPYIFDKL